MALDGIVISNIISDLESNFLNSRISKIAQPESDELLFTIKSSKGQSRILISASPSLPLIYITSENKPSPMTAPNFCMLLRKHIANGKIIRIFQPGLERIVCFEIEHYNELGDLCKKMLYVELMGKHSNIIFCNEENMIIDSIKHVSSSMSSIREVLPGRTYFIPDTMQKLDPLTVTEEIFFDQVFQKPMGLSKALYTTFTGISPVVGEELCYQSDIESTQPANTLSENEKLHFWKQFQWMITDIRDKKYEPTIVYRGNEPVEFSSLPLTHFENLKAQTFPTISIVLERYYSEKNTITRIRQKSVDLRKIVATALERNRKKYQLQEKQLLDTEKKDKFKVYGELIHTYGYEYEDGTDKMTALNYYTNEEITIPLDPMLGIKENANHYFDKYNKLKRTFEALSELIETTKEEIIHLESIQTALEIALSEDDLLQIKEELVDFGYMKRKHTNKKVKIKSQPFHYISSDGFDMYVGKNNFQNDYLTFKFAIGNDWWFHVKGTSGSHVIVKTHGKELPDKTFEEAGRLAAYYSSSRGNDKVEIDYTEKKNVKKPSGGKPGFVVYYTNYSLTIDSDISNIQLLES